jgi:putative RecB family exonuclease
VRVPSISPTRISIYLACPVKYRWTYVDGRGRWYLRAKSYYSFGNTLHHVLQRFHDSGDNGVETVGDVVAAYEESWLDAGFRSAEEMAEAYGEGREILERHVQEHLARAPEAKTLMVEKQLRFDMGPFVLAGRLDRVDEYPDGSLEVVDYKSGRGDVTEDEVASDIAMGVYQLLLRKKFPGRPVRARLVALKTGASATASFDDAQADAFEAAIRDVGAQILSEDFYERRPVPKPLCASCDFLPLCRQDPAFEE